MARDMKLKAALERHKGVDQKLERQKRVQKKAEKRKRQHTRPAVDVAALEAEAGDEEELEAEEFEEEAADVPAEEIAAKIAELQANGEDDGWESDDDEDVDSGQENGVDVEGIEDDSDSDSDLDEDDIAQDGTNGVPTNGDAENEDEEDEEDIPLSDIASLASEDRGDVIPYQRLTINNTAALLRSLKSFALPSTLPFSTTQSVTSAEPISIADIEDDLNRELAFYKQSLEAVKEARTQLKKEGVAFSRPADYFAEMVKSEEQMGKVRAKQVDAAARKKASSDARRQRDLKKFGKAVQVAKLQERDKAKRETLDKINVLKRKRQGAELNATEDDMFDVALDDAAENPDTRHTDRANRRGKRGAEDPKRKRQKKDEKFGFGGKKRFAKSNDAKSSGEMRGSSMRGMKGRGGGAGGARGGKQRLGKSRRAKMS